ncbi:MAG: Zn-dependent exopeptidase [Solirubrobacterales bacterium]|nr:Zn-dependent exopeptidase [Solirubrobacterales bacterium]
MQTSPRTDAEDVRRQLSVRILVLALLSQVVLFGGLIYFAVTGFPFVGGGGGLVVTRTSAAGAGTGTPSAPASAVDTAPDRLPQAKVDRFDGVRAYRLTAEQVGYGQRPAGSPQLAKLAERLRPLLPDGRFEALPGSTAAKPLRNIVGTIPGAKPAIVVGAHYDTLVKPQGFVGANNGASGSAIVVEVARAMRKLKRPAGAPELKFVLFDGEEPDAGLPEEQADFYHTGLRGSRAYTARHSGQTRSMLLLDYVGGRGLTLPMEATSDRTLWTQIRGAATRVGVGSIFPDRTDLSIQDDHTPFQRQGVPAVDFIDWSYPGHSLEDSMALISRRALDAVGETVVEHLRTAR